MTSPASKQKNLNQLFCNAVQLIDTGSYKLYKSLPSVVIQSHQHQENITVRQASLPLSCTWEYEPIRWCFLFLLFFTPEGGKVLVVCLPIMQMGCGAKIVFSTCDTICVCVYFPSCIRMGWGAKCRWGVVPNVFPSDSWDVAPCGCVFHEVDGGVGVGGSCQVCVFNDYSCLQETHEGNYVPNHNHRAHWLKRLLAACLFIFHQDASCLHQHQTA